MFPKITQVQFIRYAKFIHGNRYDYSKSKYVNSSTKVEIICKIHGSFWQRPANHWRGMGCKKCSKYTTKYFVERAQKIHGNKYDYSSTEYRGAHSDVAVICKKHGLFYTNANSHLRGVNCQKCANENKCINNFIDKAKKVHGNKYDYKLCNYKKSSLNVKIICPIHGVFEQNPQYHLRGGGCQKCAWHCIKHTTEQFIKQAEKVHGNKYDYSEVDYKHSRKPVKIRCKIHGIFEQTPSSHIRGAGCSDCNKGGRFGKSEYCKNNKRTKFYVLYIPTEDFFKIGITQKTIDKRYSNEQIPYRYKIYFSFESDCECIWDLECLLKKKFKKYQYKPKKHFPGMSECFSSNIKPLLNYILCATNLKSKQSRKRMLSQLLD